MIRITATTQTREEVVLKLEGWLAEGDVALLAAEGEGHLRETERLVLELTGVEFIDSAGIELLQAWAAKGMVLRGGSPFVQVLLREHGLPSE